MRHPIGVCLTVVLLGFAPVSSPVSSPVAAEVSPPIVPGSIAIALEPLAAGLVCPVLATHAGDGTGRIFVLEQTGLVRVISGGVLLEAPFLDLRDRMVAVNPDYDERGLLGLAFHPEYATNGRFFVRYSAPRASTPGEACADPDGFIVGCHTEVLSEFRVDSSDPDRALADSERVVLTLDQPEFNHDGGHAAFGPDGFLYVGFGDGGGANDGLDQDPPAHGPGGNGQNIETRLGALLRISVDGAEPWEAPPDNPFVDSPGDDAIYAYGFRNPYRFSFDRGGSRELIVADVGQNVFEELNVVVRGGNYGWAGREGAHCFDPFDPGIPPDDCPQEGFLDPFAEYRHEDGGLAVVGGHVYRGAAIPALAGHYVFGDFSADFGPTGRLYAIDMEGDRSRIETLLLGSEARPLGAFLKGLGEDESGEILVLVSSALGPQGVTGRVLRIVPVGQPQLPGDCNQDSRLDVSDAVCVFGVLFLGSPEAFPCGDGTPGDPGTRGLLDWQSDGTVDLSDGVAILNFLFSGGPAHPSAVEGSTCTPIVGCPAAPSCPE